MLLSLLFVVLVVVDVCAMFANGKDAEKAMLWIALTHRQQH